MASLLLCLLVSSFALVASQGGYGVPSSPSYAAAPAAAPVQVIGVAVPAGHEILGPGNYKGRRSGHRHSRSSSHSHSSNDDDCHKLKSKCGRGAPDSCFKADFDYGSKKTIIECSAGPGEFIQMQNEKGDLLAYGFENLRVKAKCSHSKWRVGHHHDEVSVKKVVCLRFALLPVIRSTEFSKSRSTAFNIQNFFVAKQSADLLNFFSQAVENDTKKELLTIPSISNAVKRLQKAVAVPAIAAPAAADPADQVPADQ